MKLKLTLLETDIRQTFFVILKSDITELLEITNTCESYLTSDNSTIE